MIFYSKSLLSFIRMKSFLYTSIFIIGVSCSPGNNPPNKEGGTSSDSTESNHLNQAQDSFGSKAEQDTSAFQSFIRLFDNSGTEIRDSTLTSLMIEASEVGRYTTQEFLDDDPAYLVLFLHFNPVGPGVNELHAASFTKDGTLTEESLLGSSYPSSGPDGGGEDYSYQYDKTRNLLTLTNSNIDWDEQSQEEIAKEEFHYFELTRNENLVNPRQYPEVSERMLEKAELSNKTKDELKTMRNEVFAWYGYIFKNESLKNYFSTKAWYTPQFINVDNKLSAIERENIILIKTIEDSK